MEMDTRDKTIQLLKTVKMLEGVLKTTANAEQRTRVKGDLDRMYKTLKELNPGKTNEAIWSAYHENKAEEDCASADEHPFASYSHLKDVPLLNISSSRDDAEINAAISIFVYFEQRVWKIMADHRMMKLDFSNSTERDDLYRLLEECTRSHRNFEQTVTDLTTAKTPDHVSQLQMMRLKEGRLFLFELHSFLEKVRDFVATIVSDANMGGSMVLDLTRTIVYEKNEEYKLFEGKTPHEAIRFMKSYIEQALQVVIVPDMKRK